MEQIAIEGGWPWKHAGGDIYIVHRTCLIKNKKGKWVPGVVYHQQRATLADPLYVRTEKNFRKRFTPIKA